MEVVHDTPFEASLEPILDKDGSHARVAIIKATFAIREDGSIETADEQEPIRFRDSYVGEPGQSSLRYESDGAFFKPCSDFIVQGSACSPTWKPVTQLNVSVQVNDAVVTLTVVGDRVWDSGSLGVTMSAPIPFVEMPLCWERAFGGVDTFAARAGKPAWEPRNLIGTGFRITGRHEALDGLRLPNIENPRELIRRWNDKPEPVGFDYVERSWMPRIQYAGTFDDRWKCQRSPVLPVDFDYRFFNAAPPALVSASYFDGGESVRLVNLTHRRVESFSLPRYAVSVKGYAKSAYFDLPARLDTVVVRPTERRLILVWRCKISVAVNDEADRVSACIVPLN